LAAGLRRRQSPGRTNLYDRPTGLILYAASGHMCVNIVFKADRKPFAPFTKGLLTATNEEKAAAFDAYFGTFTLDANLTAAHTSSPPSYFLTGRQSFRPD
jgi:hypothetical protein